MLVAITRPSLIPSRTALCFTSALRSDPLDARECSAGGIGDAAPTVGSRPTDPVIERLGAGPERLPHNDPTHHPRRLVRHAVVVIDSGNGELDVEGCAGLHEEARVP